MMKTDRELLELAAKAAGYTPYLYDEGREWVYVYNGGLLVHVEFDGGCDGKWWNPLEDDGDALRLATDLQMSVGFGPAIVQACTIAGSLRGVVFREDTIHQEPHSAARRAIVRAAAEIGETK